MEERCVKCGGELIEGALMGNYAARFYPSGQEKKIIARSSRTVCSCCKACGLIQNIRAVELDKLR